MPMTKLETHFARMREAPLPGALDSIDAGVFAGIAAQQEAGMTRRGLALAGAVSLVIGLSASLVPANEARAEPLLGVPAQAPSNLLGL
jgi:hypothetical protein